MFTLSESAKRFIEAIGILSLLCLAFLFFRTLTTHSLRYWFIPENLLLAWAGLMFSWFLVHGLRKWAWSSWQGVSLTLLWLFFLPNTWYVLTDFIHVYATGEISELYDIVLIMSLCLCGIILVVVSLWLVHKELLKRIKNEHKTYLLIELIIFASSFAIYLGRVLRWNSWEVITNPGGLLLNISDRVTDPLGHMHAVNFTGLMFVLISGIYFAFYRGLSALNTSKTKP